MLLLVLLYMCCGRCHSSAASSSARKTSATAPFFGHRLKGVRFGVDNASASISPLRRLSVTKSAATAARIRCSSYRAGREQAHF